jgi:hypothetical protein
MRVPAIVSPRSVRVIAACSSGARVIAVASLKLTLHYSRLKAGGAETIHLLNALKRNNFRDELLVLLFLTTR